MKKIIVLGAGAMGSAFTVPCIDNKHKVYLVTPVINPPELELQYGAPKPVNAGTI